MEQVYSPQKDYKVFVRCNTFNQSKYIEDALNGFAMQQTNFPFVCLVMDDCSTDGEQEVIMSWMERECDLEKAEYLEIELSNVILVPHKSNGNCIGEREDDSNLHDFAISQKATCPYCGKANEILCKSISRSCSDTDNQEVLSM